MTNLDSILKSRDISLPKNVHLVKAMVFPVVMYGCEDWTLKKAERWRMDAFELWCWRRLLRVPWTARRSKQSIWRKLVLNIHWRDSCCSWNSNTLATWCKELTRLKIPWYWERLKVREEGYDRGWDGWMASSIQWTSVWVVSGSCWWTGRPGVLQSIEMTELLNWTVCSTLIVSSFRIWNISDGIPSLPLAFLVVMLPKVHFTLHSRMSGSRWVITASWLYGLWGFFFVQCFCVFLPPLINIFCFSYVHTISVLYWTHLCMKFSLGISNFLEERSSSSLSHPIVFLYFFALIIEAGYLISPCYSWNSASIWVYHSFSPLPFSPFLFLAFYKASADNYCDSLHFFFLGMILILVSFTMSVNLSL